MLAATLRRHVGLGAFEHLEQRLLHAFARNVASDRDVLAGLADLVNLVDVDDAALSSFDVEVGGMQQLEQQVFDVFADVPGFGQSRGIADRKRNIEALGQGASEQRLAAAGGADEQDVRLAQLDIGALGAVVEPLVMIVHRHRKCLLGGVLPYHILIKSFPNLCRLRHADVRRLTPGVFVELLVENAFADVDAAVANVNTRACDELAHLSVALATEGAHGEIRSARHMVWISALPFPRQYCFGHFHQPAIRRRAAV